MSAAERECHRPGGSPLLCVRPFEGAAASSAHVQKGLPELAANSLIRSAAIIQQLPYSDESDIHLIDVSPSHYVNKRDHREFYIAIAQITDQRGAYACWQGRQTM